MNIELARIKVGDIFKGYIDKDDDGEFAFSGKLAIRPAYQRNFIYTLEESERVIHTALKGYPLNVMYWVLTDGSYTIGDDDSLIPSADAKFEILDGQQRTVSLMKFLDHKFDITLDEKRIYWDSLTDDQYADLMDYRLMIYICSGSDSEKLAWFEVVNIAGKKLTAQELLNKTYTGPWLTAAKKIFSKRKCPAKGLSDKYITGDPNRQELLEKALKGISEFQGLSDHSAYMAAHKGDADADELWQYYQDVINWIQKIFPKYYSDMKGLDWTHLYNTYHNNTYNSATMASEVERLHKDDEVQKPKGIYEFLLCRETDPYAGRLLNLRAFETRDKMHAYAKQGGICPDCKKHFEYEEMEGDHIRPWSKGGKTVPENCQMLCKNCNAHKTDKY